MSLPSLSGWMDRLRAGVAGLRPDVPADDAGEAPSGETAGARRTRTLPGSPESPTDIPVREVVERALLGDTTTTEGPGRSRTIVLDAEAPPGLGGAVQTVNRLLLQALESRASDIHLEDYADGLRVRHRIDGLLRDVDPPRSKLRGGILARLRVMAGMNLAEHRQPQDGRMRVRYGDRTVDIRVSSVPMLNGESMALRVLDPTRERLKLDELGLRADDLDALADVIARPNGMILTTGPGGAGKSTTLHAIVDHISTGREKIITVEDPVEFDVPGICQVPVNLKIGLTFAALLRAIVRQDPDVLLVGEIRDAETAQIATNAALTGHLVLSTLHTTDAVSTLHRMHDLGVPDYLVAHTVEAVMAQRLVREVCRDCAEEVPLPAAEAAALGPEADGMTHTRRGGGCGTCGGSGYFERTGIYELLLVTDRLREAFLARHSTRELREIALEQGMRTLRADGVAKIREGVTTPEEVLRVS